MDLLSGISLIFRSIPTVTALASLMLLLVTYQERAAPISGSLRRIALLLYSASIVTTMGSLLFSYSPSVFSLFSPLHFGALLIVPVLLYHLVWIVTSGVNVYRSFKGIHYLAPVLASLALSVWSCFIPYEVKIEITLHQAETITGSDKAYAYISNLRMEARLLFNAIYLTLCLLRVRQFSNVADHEQENGIPVKSWTRLLTVLLIVALAVSLVGVVNANHEPYKSILSIAVGLALGTVHIELACRLIKGYFPLAKEEYKIMELRTGNDNEEPINKKLNKRFFQKWIRKHKPYLDPSFTINDLSKALHINRTYVSNFINETYGMNFSRYLNRCRLKELQRLQRLPSNKEKTAASLIQKAGFGSYRSYQRIKSMEKEQPTNKTNRS